MKLESTKIQSFFAISDGISQAQLFDNHLTEILHWISEPQLMLLKYSPMNE